MAIDLAIFDPIILTLREFRKVQNLLYKSIYVLI